MLKNIHLLKAILRNRTATKRHYSNTEFIPFLSDKYYVEQSYIMCSSETMTFNHLQKEASHNYFHVQYSLNALLQNVVYKYTKKKIVKYQAVASCNY